MIAGHVLSMVVFSSCYLFWRVRLQLIVDGSWLLPEGSSMAAVQDSSACSEAGVAQVGAGGEGGGHEPRATSHEYEP